MQYVCGTSTPAPIAKHEVNSGPSQEYNPPKHHAGMHCQSVKRFSVIVYKLFKRVVLFFSAPTEFLSIFTLLPHLGPAFIVVLVGRYGFGHDFHRSFRLIDGPDGRFGVGVVLGLERIWRWRFVAAVGLHLGQ